jgi:hypothetical protein
MTVRIENEYSKTVTIPADDPRTEEEIITDLGKKCWNLGNYDLEEFEILKSETRSALVYKGR